MQRLFYDLVRIMFLIVITNSCVEHKDDAIKKTDQANARPESSYQISNTGDTIFTGVPIPVKGKWINPDSVSPPRVVSARPPIVVSMPTNVHPAGKPKVVEIPRELPGIIPGKDGIPLPAVRKAKGRVAPAKQPQPIPAQAPVMKSDAVANFQLLGILQGMSSVFVSSILEDRNGNIWFSSGGGGISRYDGRSFTHYSENEGLSYSSVHSMMEDSHGNLWIGADRQRGMSKYDGHNFTYFAEKDGFSNHTVRCMLEDSKGNIWFGTEGGGAIRYDPDQGDRDGGYFTHFTTTEGLTSNIVLSMLEDSKGNIWFGTEGGGAIRYDPDQGDRDGGYFTHFTTTEGLSGNTVKSILEDSKGNLWFGTYGGGISCLDGGRFFHYTTEEGLSNDLVESILEDSRGNLWVGTDGGGVNKYEPDKERGSFTYYTTKEGLSSNTIQPRLEDSRGNLWFGAHRAGVIRYDGKSFTYYDHLGAPRLEDNKGNLLADYSGGIRIYDYDRHFYTQYPMQKDLARNYSSTIMQDSCGNIWIGVRGEGLRKYDGQNVTYYTEQQGLSSNDVSSLMEDSRGNIWIGTHDNGVNRYDPAKNRPGGSFTQFTEKEGLVHFHVHPIMEDSKGNIWIGTDGGGVSKYDGQFFTHYTKNEGLTTNQINTIIEDSKGNIWFGTWNGGLNIYDGKSFTYIDKKDGLSNNIIQSIVEDSLGRFWVSTEQGLNLLIPDSSSLSSPDHFQIISFGEEDGLRSINVGDGFLDSKNRIWWAQAMLDLNRFELPAEPPRIQLNHIELEQTFLDYRRLADTSYLSTLSFENHLHLSFDSVAPFYNYPLNLELPHQINHLTFHFSAIDWTAPHDITYQFMLEGLDEDWNPITSENKADYRSIPPGAYTFKVRAASQSMLWSEPFQYTFTIKPPWWLSWWAYCLYALIIIGLFLAVRQYELKRLYTKTEALRLKELNTVKTRLYTNITHEFRTPLTIISGMADQIIDPAESKELIRRNSRRLLHLINQMLGLAKLETGNLSLNMIQADVIAFLQYLVESFHSYAESKQISLGFYAETHNRVMDFDEEKLQSIVSNLLSNAIKFSPQGSKIIISVKEKIHGNENKLVIKVKDNGIGIPREKLAHVFDSFYKVDDSHTREEGEGTGIGLTLTKELVELMGGSIDVQSKLGEGSGFTVILPVSHNAPLKEVKMTTKAESFIPIKQNVGITPENVMVPNEDRALLLVIEDNRDVITYIRTCLQENYEIVSAENGAVGIEKALDMVPDIIISDVMMPLKDGFEVCATLKNDERTSHIPIILLTAKVDIASRIEGLERGADAYLAKPFEKRELLVRLQKLVELRRRLQERYAGGIIPAPSTDKGLQMEDAFLQKIRRQVEEHLDDADFGIPELCQALLLSRSQLHRKLKALTNQTTSQIIRSIRLQNGKVLLQTTELTVSEVAYDTGFRNPNHFSRVFKEEFGVTPSELRKQD